MEREGMSMGRKRPTSDEVPATAIQDEMDALRVEMARLKRRETELAGHLAARVKAEEDGVLRLLGAVLLRDLDPALLPAEGDGLHAPAKRDLARRSAWFALRIRAAVLDKGPRPRLVDELLTRLDEQATRDRYVVPPRLDDGAPVVSDPDRRLVSHHG